MSTKLSICIIGCGHMAARHAHNCRRLRQQISLYFASRDIEKARSYCQRYRGVGFFGSYQSALADPRVDAVIICTPHNHHLENALAAASNRKHILIEKPMACTLAEADAMIRQAESYQVKLMVAENFHFKPSVRLARRIISCGLIGAVRMVRISAMGFGLRPGWRQDREAMCGGAFIDGGIHWVNTLLNLAGDAESVFAASTAKLADMAGEDSIFVLAKMRSGAIGQINHSVSAKGIVRRQLTVVSGTEGALYIDNDGLFVLLNRPDKRKIFFPSFRDRRGFLAMLHEFVTAVRENREPDMTGEKGRRDLAFVLAAYESLRTGRREPVSH